jgi:hypothetical protein
VDEPAFVSLQDFLRARPPAAERSRDVVSALTVLGPPAPDAATAALTAPQAAGLTDHSRLSSTAKCRDNDQLLNPAECRDDSPLSNADRREDYRALPNADGLANPSDDRPDTEMILGAKLFGAALADAFDMLLPELVRGLAAEVLGRELRLAAVDLEALARRLIAERLAQGPVRLRVAPSEANVICELPVVTDPALRPGDVVLECRSGDIDARLRTRLAAVLAAVRR